MITFFFLDFFLSGVDSRSNEATEPTCELAAEDSRSFKLGGFMVSYVQYLMVN